VSDRWLAALVGAAGRADAGWWVHYAVAMGHHVRGAHDAAHAAYVRSVEHTPTAVAVRGLAVLAEDVAEADELFARATELDPADRRLATERLVALQEAGRHEELLAVVDELPEPVRAHGRTRLVVAQALAATGRDAEALEMLASLEVPDLAEGDNSTADLWLALRPGEPVPQRLDFRMAQDGPGAAGH
jgi:hypothetical protein